MREALAHLYWSAIEAARGDRILRDCSHLAGDRWRYEGPGGALDVTLPGRRGRVIVAGAGKAAASLASGLEEVLGDRIADGLVIVKHAHLVPLNRIEILEASHPVPDATSVDATRHLLQMLDATTSEDCVFFLLTGGASALLCLPAGRITLDDKAAATSLLLNSGADILELNAVRRHLSAVKGGKLRARSRARFYTLAISDVVGDDLAAIGSGPTVRDRSTARDALDVIHRYGLDARMPPRVMAHLQHERQDAAAGDDSAEDAYRILASNRNSLEACAQRAKDLGFDVEVLTDRMTGETHAEATVFANALLERSAQERRRPLALLAGGETTLTVRGNGKGGRNQEFALSASLLLDRTPNVTLLVAGTDGTDGPTDATGAFVDGRTVGRARAAGRDVRTHLLRNDAYPLLDALGDLFRTGPTGTNVMDLAIGIVE